MDDLSDFVLWKQGAEGKVYRGEFLGYPAVVKERFPKKYRHPVLDQHLTQERFKSEARMLTRCKNAGKLSKYLWTRMTRVFDAVFWL